MGFCTEEEYEEFLRFCPQFELSLQNEGVTLVKYWLSVSDEEQERRFEKRLDDPRKRWKFSPVDLQARARWVDYAEAKDRMFARTDSDASPWYVVEADDKRTARLNLISHLLSRVPYERLPAPDAGRAPAAPAASATSARRASSNARCPSLRGRCATARAPRLRRESPLCRRDPDPRTRGDQRGLARGGARAAGPRAARHASRSAPAR